MLIVVWLGSGVVWLGRRLHFGSVPCLLQIGGQRRYTILVPFHVGEKNLRDSSERKSARHEGMLVVYTYVNHLSMNPNMRPFPA